MRPWILPFLIVSLSLASCVAVDVAPHDDPASDDVEGRGQAIINGTLDTAHPAVVAIFGRDSLCSGTIIQTDPVRGIGWVLTAAHCVDSAPEVVIQGRDFNDPDVTYEVIDFEEHPAYSPESSAFDFAVVRFAGASRNTPVIPVAGATDNLSRGSQITSVGFGRTNPSDERETNNSQRRTITRPLSGLDERFLIYSLATGGICSGDSGGAVLATVNGAERVVGVHSSVTEECRGEGFNGRVSGVFNTWLRGVLSGQVEESCDLCRQVAQSGDGQCTPVIERCLNTPACANLVNCLNNCQTDACSEQCVTNNRAGLNDYTAIFDCTCEDACGDICAGDPACPEGPACGLAFADEACNGCTERACCAQTEACSNDDTCLACINGEASRAACDANAAFTAFFGCLDDRCGMECGLEVECGFASGDPSCGACIDGSCCAQGAACANDDICLECMTGDGQGCDTNRNLSLLLTCLAECDGDPCGAALEPEPEGNPEGNPGADPEGNPGAEPEGNPEGNPGADPEGNPDGGFVTGGGADAQPSGTCLTVIGRRPSGDAAALLALLAALGLVLRRRRT